MESPISVHVWTLIQQAINVLVVLLVLHHLLFKPLHQLMENRTRFVEQSLAEAKSQKEEAAELLAKYQEQLRNAQAEAREIVNAATREAEELARRRRQETEAETQALIARAKAEIENERRRALASIRDEVATLTLMVAERVIGRELNQEDHRRLVQDMLADVNAREPKVGDLQ
jgi:F-type H+-transporting ATPase subunit b